MAVLNVAFYRFVNLIGGDAPAILRPTLLAECAALGLRGTILLAPEGINGFLAGDPERLRAFIEGLRVRAPFAGLETKESFSETQPFGKLRIKLKREIISMRTTGIVPAVKTGPRISAQELKRWLDEGRDFELLDTRNEYEFEQGSFVGARSLGLGKFQDFPDALARDRAERSGASRPVVMFCTGGIRCEKATALALERGEEQVFQLEGGILKYFEEVGDAHYRGGCFVFDDRRCLNPELKPQ